MIHPIAMQAVVKVQQREVLEKAKWHRRVQATFDDQPKAREAQISLAPCGQTGKKNILAKGTLS